MRLPATNRRDAGCRPSVAAKTFCRPFLREFGRQRALSAIRGRQNALLAIFTRIWPTTGVVGHPWPSKHFFAFRCVQKIGKHKNGCSPAAAGTDDPQHAPSRSVSKLCRSSVSNKIACRSFLGENDRQTASAVMPDFPRALHRILPLRLPATNRRDAGCRPSVAAKTFCRPFLREFGRQRALSATRGRQNTFLPSAVFRRSGNTRTAARRPPPGLTTCSTPLRAACRNFVDHL